MLLFQKKFLLANFLPFVIVVYESEKMEEPGKNSKSDYSEICGVSQHIFVLELNFKGWIGIQIFIVRNLLSFIGLEYAYMHKTMCSFI